MKKIFVIILGWFLFGNINAQSQFDDAKGTCIYMKWSYLKEYKSQKDAQEHQDKLNTFYNKTGYTIQDRVSGNDIFYISHDTLFSVLYYGINPIPKAYNIQIGRQEAYIYNYEIGFETSMLDDDVEKRYDYDLVENWRDSISSKSVLDRDYSKVKKLKKKEIILGFECDVYKDKYSTGYTLYYVAHIVVPPVEQYPRIFFDRVFFPDGIMLRRKVIDKAYTLTQEVEELRFGNIIGLHDAIISKDHTFIDFDEIRE